MQILVGLVIGIVLGCIALYLIDRHHKEELHKLQESRNKLERQRTQAVNDLFEMQNNGTVDSPVMPVANPTSDPKVAAEIANLKNLVVRADRALTTARRKRNEYEAEIADLKAQLAAADGATVINLRDAKESAI